ncbi:glycoside hydrolase family 18 protein [Babjeviella inositovora NRRL Y-12698]|uniref:chitinase n=1 Tax=Babjeviella inositovora NRRL Y-12698 TaxID=984486 RepID=A0A1E3QWE0_9ASCO|nr:glycoside hydrolase family 18 protein [Babjeviella inositovora NRRL Y-12698]ODQ81941.1 glycoside hydrolase family 18 protein [Babjeviella inositovora NRRL Y-12698]
MSIRTCMYYTNWSVYEPKNHQARDIPLENVTNLFYAFIAMDIDTGKLKFSDEWADIQKELDINGVLCKGSLGQIYALKQKFRHTKVSMSIGGWGTSETFVSIVSDEAKFANLVASCMFFVSEYGFDGIDVDWEYPQNAVEAARLVELLRRLRSGLDELETVVNLGSGSMLLSIAAPAAPEQASILQASEIDQYVSFWNLMCYDYTGAWSGQTGYHSNLFGGALSTDLAVKYYIQQGVNPQKLVIGMPNYGRGFSGTTREIGNTFNGVGSGSSGDAGVWLYKTLPLPGTTEEFDYRKVSASCYEPVQGLLVVYDNQQSAKIKAKYVLSNGLGGAMWWESCGEDYANLERSTLHNFVATLGSDCLERCENNLSYPSSAFLTGV